MAALPGGVNSHPTLLTPRELKKTLVSEFANQLPLVLPHDSATPLHILETVMLATGRRSSVTDASEHHPLLHPDTIFDHLRAFTHEAVETSVRAMNTRVLQAAKQRGKLPAQGKVGIDLHVDPEYTAKHTGSIGYKDLPGTDYGMAYLSADLLEDPRFTLSFKPVHQLTNREDALRFVVEEALRWIDATLFLLDRGFQAAYAFRLFTQAGKRFVIPMISNPRLQALEREAWRLKQAIPNTPYAWHLVRDYDIGPSKGEKAVVNVVIFYEPDPKEPGKLKPFIFATNVGEVTAAQAMDWAEHYRQRWGIETGYRIKDTLRLRTTSDHYPTRLLLQLFTIPAYNLWILCRALWTGKAWMDERPMKQGYLIRHYRDDMVAAFGA